MLLMLMIVGVLEAPMPELGATESFGTYPPNVRPDNRPRALRMTPEWPTGDP